MNNKIVAERIKSLAKELKAGVLGDEKSAEWMKAAMNRNTPPKELDSLMDKGSVMIQLQVLKNPNAPASAFEKADYQSFQMRLAAALHPNTPTKVLDELDGNREIREAVASHPHTSPKKLDELSKSPDFHIRYAVAKNPHASEATLKNLANDKIKNVKELAEKALLKK